MSASEKIETIGSAVGRDHATVGDWMTSMDGKRLVTREALIAEVRSYIDTPFRHQGRSLVKGVRGRVDCVGLHVNGCRGVGINIQDTKTYGRVPDGVMLAEWMDKNCDRVPMFGRIVATGEIVRNPNAIFPGNIGVFWMRKERKWPQHLGMFVRMADGAMGMVHTYAAAGHVSEHHLTQEWLDRLLMCYTIRGVETPWQQ